MRKTRVLITITSGRGTSHRKFTGYVSGRVGSNGTPKVQLSDIHETAFGAGLSGKIAFVIHGAA